MLLSPSWLLRPRTNPLLSDVSYKAYFNVASGMESAKIANSARGQIAGLSSPPFLNLTVPGQHVVNM